MDKEQYSPMQGGIISHIVPGSIAESLFLQSGDIVLEIDGLPLHDVIEYRFAIAEETLRLLVHTREGPMLYDIEKDAEEDLGIEFHDAIFDQIHTCHNDCLFCFVQQLPKGLRKTLYVRDDDYRLSFLYGNFITLTNLKAEDWQRIIQYHLSPLYISVHTTDQALRASLMGRRDIPDIQEQICRLGEAGIHVHTQVVVCPGINDGTVLYHTIQDLAKLFPIVQSIAVVPVGITNYYLQHIAKHHYATLRSHTREDAIAIVEMVKACGKEYQQHYGCHIVYPSDEFVLLSQQDVPQARFYDGYPQFFNGVGMTRDFLDLWHHAQRYLVHRIAHPTRIALVCGTLIAPMFARIAERLNRIVNVEATIVPVVNRFFGNTVTVSGLLTGQDVVSTLKYCHYDKVFLPRAMFDYTGIRTLDDYHLPRIMDETNLSMDIADHPNDLVRYVQFLA